MPDSRSRPTAKQGGSQNLEQGQSTPVDGQADDMVVAQLLNYQAQGRVVVPACWEPCAVPWHDKPCSGKVPLVKTKGRNKVTAEQIRRWWQRWPLASVAILTGARSNLVVIDLDGPEGEAVLRRLEALYGKLPPTLEVKTKRGRHLYFAHPGGYVLTRKGDDFWPEGKEQANAHGLDVRGDGGLVIAPPSPNRTYVNELEPAELPESWAEPFRTRTSAAGELDDNELSEALEKVRTEGDPCSCMERVLDRHAQHEGGRHGAVIAAQRALTAFGRELHPGAGKALDQLQDAFLADKPDGEHEWNRGLAGAVAIAMETEPAATGCPYSMKDPLAEVQGDLGALLDAHGERVRAKAQEPEPEEPSRFEAEVAKRQLQIWINEEAQRRHRERETEQLPEPELTSLTDLLDEPDDDPTYRIDGLWPTGGNIILAAARKAGKTTLVGNLARSLVDGDAFLGMPGPAHVNGFEVTPADGMVAILDLELDRRMLRRWLRDQAIGKRDQVMAESLRGRVHLFDVLDDKRRGKWARVLEQYGVKVLILDPLGALLDAYGRDENSNSDVGPVLQALDALKAEAGISELFIAHHMGHQGERSRGASKLRGWPDGEWFLVREKAPNGEEPPPDAVRFFLAEGRDVMVPEAQVSYDPGTRRLMVAGGNRVQHQATKHGPALLEIIEQTPGLSQQDIVQAAMGKGIPKHPATNALHKLIGDGLVRTEKGKNNAKLHHPVQDSVPVSRSFPAASRETTQESVPVSRGLWAGKPDTPAAAGQSDDQDQELPGTLDPFAHDFVGNDRPDFGEVT
jgi:hypothetical protein